MGMFCYFLPEGVAVTWFFLKDVLCVSALPDSCLSPDTPFPLSGCISACRAVGCPQELGARADPGGGPILWPLALRAPGFVYQPASWPRDRPE